MGNKKANSYWEAELPPNYDRVGIENFIRAKYGYFHCFLNVDRLLYFSVCVCFVKYLLGFCYYKLDLLLPKKMEPPDMKKKDGCHEIKNQHQFQRWWKKIQRNQVIEVHMDLPIM